LTEDLKKIDIPVLVMHGDDDQIVPIVASALLSSKLLKNATLKVYPGFPHGMPATNADVINEDLLAFFKGRGSAQPRNGPREKLPLIVILKLSDEDSRRTSTLNRYID